MEIGTRIKRLRESKGLSQSALGELIGANKQAISKYENHVIKEIPLKNIEGIAKALGVSPVYLVGWEDKAETREIEALERKTIIEVDKAILNMARRISRNEIRGDFSELTLALGEILKARAEYSLAVGEKEWK